ncbi:hypothetical protein AB0M54_23345 [Actinoplanes sp. NPDC051470]|uniref:hypothetical protein n=1 Tax=unclassified Actinoplanes TaxID=2626549 RepID=UPI00341B774A
MRVRKASVLLVAAMAASALGVSASPASAAAELSATYPINGVSHIASNDSDLPLGPGSLHATVNLDSGALAAEVSLPAATGEFKELGFIPVTATVELTEAEPTTGQLDLNTGQLRTTSHITMRLTRLTIAGLPAPVGSRCQTREPAEVPLTSQPGFSVLRGGVVTGTYTIPPFQHCLLNTGLINLTIPGSGNTLSLTLGPAVVG